MIDSHKNFEDALEEATGLLAHRPPQGTPDHERLLALMADIAAYHPAVIVDKHEAPSEADRLSERMKEFENRLAPHFTSHWHSMLGGDVVSPKSK